MNKILKSIVLTATFSILLTASCNMPVAAPTPTPPPTATIAPTQTATAIPLSTPTEIASATPAFAPYCAPEASVPPPIQCESITAEETSVLCANKKPFNIIFINKGSTYDAITRGFYCTDGGVRDQKQVITCTGNMASEYQVSVCDPACVIPTAQASITQCPQDYQYNSQLGCCTQDFIQLQQNCRVFTFKTTTCKVDCSVYAKKNDCEKNSIGCIWLPDKKQCIGRE